MFRLHQICIFLRNSNGSSVSEALLKSLCSFSASIPQYPFSSSSLTSSTVDFFVNNLGVSPDSALAAAKTIRGKSTAKSDAVLALLKRYGFSYAKIADIFTRRPSLLLSDPEKNLQPKFEFLSRNGISGEALVTVVSTNPTILRRSLNKQIKPCIELLNSFYGNSGDVVSFFTAKRGTRFLHMFSERMGPNIDTLRSYGVPNAGIQRMMTVRPRALCLGSPMSSVNLWRRLRKWVSSRQA